MRAVLAVVAGFVLWTVLWLGGNAGLGAVFPEAAKAFADGGALDGERDLGAALLLAAVCSFVAGRLCAAVGRARGPVLALAVLLLVVGAAVQASAWERMPLWYHLAFLALLVPLTLVGGRRRATG